MAPLVILSTKKFQFYRILVSKKLLHSKHYVPGVHGWLSLIQHNTYQHIQSEIDKKIFRQFLLWNYSLAVLRINVKMACKYLSFDTPSS